MRTVVSLVAALLIGATLLFGAFEASRTFADDEEEVSPPPPIPSPSPSPAVAALGPSPYRARSPEYGMNVFVWGNPSTTDRDLGKVRDAGFTWQKTLFMWKQIEPARGQFNFTESDRVIRQSAANGIKVIARLDFQPTWARLDGAHNGPPDNYDDFGRFITALVTRYRADSDIGPLQAIEVWNEPNLNREWGNQPINEGAAGDYVRLLQTAYTAAKAADAPR